MRTFINMDGSIEKKGILFVVFMLAVAIITSFTGCQEDDTPKVNVETGPVEYVPSATYVNVMSHVHTDAGYSSILSAGVCYDFKKSVPSVDDKCVYATEVDDEGYFTVSLSKFMSAPLINYCAFVKTSSGIYYGETKSYLGNGGSVATTKIKEGSVKPHKLTITSYTDWGPVSPNDYEVYVCYSRYGESISFDQAQKVRAHLTDEGCYEAEITGLDYDKRYTFQTYLQHKSDGENYAGGSADYAMPKFQVGVITGDAPAEILVSGMTITHKVDLIFAEMEELKDVTIGMRYRSNFGIDSYGAGRLVGNINEKDSTYSIILPALLYNNTYEYTAFYQVPNDPFDRDGEWKRFTTPLPNLCSGAVDMGLSVKWGNCNLGATQPEELGQRYLWGETTPKSESDWEGLTNSWQAYKYSSGTSDHMTKYCVKYEGEYNTGTPDGKTVLEPMDDAATTLLGGAWHTPTSKEWEELRSKCTWTYMNLNNQSGNVVVAKNGNAIFFPFMDYSSAYHLCDDAYWTSNLSPWSTSKAAAVSMTGVRDCDYVLTDESRCRGLMVRPVCK